MQVVIAKSERDPRWIQRNRKTDGRSDLGRQYPLSSRGGVIGGNGTGADAIRANRRAAGYLESHSFAKMSAADKAELERLLSNQNTVSRKIAAQFLAAVDRLAAQVDIARIRDLLQAGRVSEALNAVDPQLAQTYGEEVARGVSAQTVWAGQQAALALTQVFAPQQIQFHFGVTNPETINYLRNHEMALIRGLAQDALASVRTVITDGVTAGRNPLDVARDVRQFIGLTPKQTQAVLNYRRALENLDRDALQRQLRDQRFDPTVRTAIGNGAKLPKEYVDKLVERYRQRFLKYRSETIARTEAIRAVNAGNVQLWKQAAQDGKVDAAGVTKKWIATHDGRTRHAHLTIPMLNPDGVELDQAFKSELGPIRFPGDPDAVAANTINCRCALFMRYRTPAARQAA